MGAVVKGVKGRSRVAEVKLARRRGRLDTCTPLSADIECLVLFGRGWRAVDRNRVRRRVKAALGCLEREGRVNRGVVVVAAVPEMGRMPWNDFLERILKMAR